MRVATSKGDFVLETHRNWGPIGADRLYNLSRAGFFDDSRFYRVVPNYIAQFGIAGSPEVAGIWRGEAIADDPPRGSNTRGTFGYAMTGPGTRTTQIYINLSDNLRNDNQGFTILGTVVEGMDVVDRLYSGYGDNSGGGMRAGRQAKLFVDGRNYLDTEYPLLDRLFAANVSPYIP